MICPIVLSGVHGPSSPLIWDSLSWLVQWQHEPAGHYYLLEEKPAHHPLEPLDVALKHTGWMPPAYLYSLAESAKVEGKRIVNSDIN